MIKILRESAGPLVAVKASGRMEADSYAETVKLV